MDRMLMRVLRMLMRGLAARSERAGRPDQGRMDEGERRARNTAQRGRQAFRIARQVERMSQRF